MKKLERRARLCTERVMTALGRWIGEHTKHAILTTLCPHIASASFKIMQTSVARSRLDGGGRNALLFLLIYWQVITENLL